MVEDFANSVVLSANLSDIINEEEYEYMNRDLATVDGFDLNIMTSGSSLDDENSLNNAMPMAMVENQQVLYEDYKFAVVPGSYLQNFFDAFPPSEPNNVCNTDYSGPYNFEVFVDPNGLKNPWEFSASLNKIYIDIKHKFPINFSVKLPTNIEDQQLFVRVMPIYEEDRYFQDLVHRCICHEQPQEKSNQGIPSHVIQHVMRCDNNQAQYCGDRNTNKRLNIIIPLGNPQAGTDSVKEFFQFVCKSSCVGGMGRRPIQVIFTLENHFGDVLGRRVLCVRICSCPKRDREKDEAKNEKSRAPPQGKKRKLEKKVNPPSSTVTKDVEVHSLVLDIVGGENYKIMLKTAERLMCTEIVKLEGQPRGNDAPYRKCLNEIRALQNKQE